MRLPTISQPAAAAIVAKAGGGGGGRGQGGQERGAGAGVCGEEGVDAAPDAGTTKGPNKASRA